ncbi:MAG TPA: D-alanyl-D-alanine carboxypeptidase family protein [Bacilli bacterium]
MLRSKLQILLLGLCLSLLINPLFVIINPLYVNAEEETVDSSGQVALQLEVNSAILMEAGTGQILFDYQSDTAYPPASMAKMMTEYIVLDKIGEGTLKWTDVVTISAYASSVIGSGQLLAEGETYTIEDMFKNMSIYSGNDAAVALAEHIGGNEENFAKLMNTTAGTLGLSDLSHFINATGLSRKDMGAEHAPADIEGETLLTARDAAMLAFHIVNDHPEALKYTSVPQAYLREGDETSLMKNWNWMLDNWKPFKNIFAKKYAYTGLDGLKTGHTTEAGYCFAGTAERGGMRLISVVMGAKSEAKRFDETKKLLDYGFGNFEKKTVLTAKTEMTSLKTVKIKKGVETEIAAVTEAGLEFIVKKGALPEQFTTKAKAFKESKLVAPIKKGDVVGTVTVTYKEKDKETVQKVNLIAAEDAEKASWFRLFFRAIRDFFKDIFSGIKNIF